MASSASGRAARRQARPGLLAVIAGAMVFGVLAPGSMASAADKKPLDEYATWDDVVAAQDDVDKQNALIAEIRGQIEDLKVQVAEAEKEADAAGAAYASAQNAATEQRSQTHTLQTQAEEARAKADESESEAGAYTAAMVNNLPSDPTVQLLAQPENADQFLRGMSTVSKLGKHNDEVYQEALSARNNADQLAGQAEEALAELERLEAEAQSSYQAAVTAQQNVQRKRDQKISKGSELEAMLKPLMEHRDVVTADYKEGERLREEERKRQEEERRRKAEEARRQAEEARRKAAEEAQQNAAESGGSYSPPPAPSGGGGSNPKSGKYAYPMDPAGWITDYFGPRLHPVYGYWKVHTGIDIVVPGGTCGAPIYAVTDGVVTLASYMDGWGNLLVYEDADGTVFMNAHITDGGFVAYPGEHVSAGDIVAYAGTTGPSTGCHLHFQIEIGGTPIDPLPWLADRGMYYS